MNIKFKVQIFRNIVQSVQMTVFSPFLTQMGTFMFNVSSIFVSEKLI